MSTTAIDPNPRFHETDSAQDALEVRVLWGSELLCVTHLSPPRAFVIGDEDDVDFTVPSSALGATRLELPMHDGETIAAGLAFQVRTVASAVRVGSAKPSVAGFVRDNGWLVASLGAHLALLLLFALLPPSASAISLQDLRRDDRYLDFVMIPDEMIDDEQMPDPTDAQSDGGESGAAHAGERGAMGDEKAPRRKTRSGVKGKPEQDTVLARERQLKEATEGGILGLLAAAAPKYDGPTSIFGAQFAEGRDLENALGRFDGQTIASAWGVGGLAPYGTGRGGGGRALGAIGVDKLGTRGGRGVGDGIGDGIGAGLGRREPKVPRKLRVGRADISGGLAKEVIRRRIQRQLPQVRHCYEQTLVTRPELQGRVSIKFIIGATGEVRAAVPTASTLGHPGTEQCIARAIKRIPFPQPDGGGIVTVTYPFVFSRI